MSERPYDLAKGIVIGTLIGGLIGVVLGVLYAPGSGRETREALAEKTHAIADRFREECEKAIEKSRGTYEVMIRQLKEQEKEIIRRTEKLVKTLSER